MMKKTIIFILIFIAGHGYSATNPKEDFKEYIKEYNKTFESEGINLMDIENKYGDIVLITQGIDESKIRIHVDVKVQANSEVEAQQIFGRIHININRRNDLVIGKTEIEQKKYSWWSSFSFINKDEFKIIYTVELPERMNINLFNKYGNISCQKIAGASKINLKYGDMFGERFTSPIDLTLKYGNGVLQKCTDINLDMAYGSLKVNESNNMWCNSRYSKLKGSKANELVLTCRYDEIKFLSVKKINFNAAYSRLNIKNLSKLKCNSKYSNIFIDTLNEEGDIDFSYGDVEIVNLLEGFEFLTGRGRYGDFNFEIKNKEGIEFILKTTYGDIDFSTSYNFCNIVKKSNVESLECSNGNGNSKVKISLSYGDINVDEE